MSEDPREFLEAESLIWKRDFDALILGFVLGVLATLAMQGVW